MAEVDSIAGVFSNINSFQVFSFEGRLKHCVQTAFLFSDKIQQTFNQLPFKMTPETQKQLKITDVSAKKLEKTQPPYRMGFGVAPAAALRGRDAHHAD